MKENFPQRAVTPQKEGFYKEQKSLKNRTEIIREYGRIEEILNSFFEKKLNAGQLAKDLGNMALGTGDEHPSSQIYAYESLLKSLSEIDIHDKDAIDTIVEEIIYDATLKDPIKSAYIRGILHHFSSKDRLDQLDENLRNGQADVNDQKNQDEIKIISLVRSGSERLKKAGTLEEMEEMIDTVLNNFQNEGSNGNGENELARLISHHYEKHPNCTELPDPGKKKKGLLNDEALYNAITSGSSGIPRNLVLMAQGWHPSAPKIQEAKKMKIDLNPVAAVEDEDGNLLYVDFDTDPELSQLYNSRIRHYRDMKNWERVETLENALKERIWRILNEQDPEMAKIIDSKEKLIILKRTVRDYSEDEKKKIEENNKLMESVLKSVSE